MQRHHSFHLALVFWVLQGMLSAGAMAECKAGFKAIDKNDPKSWPETVPMGPFLFKTEFPNGIVPDPADPKAKDFLEKKILAVTYKIPKGLSIGHENGQIPFYAPPIENQMGTICGPLGNKMDLGSNSADLTQEATRTYEGTFFIITNKNDQPIQIETRLYKEGEPGKYANWPNKEKIILKQKGDTTKVSLDKPEE
ncbi:MAG: hypothetical protein ACKOA8_02270, partial [Deltaproteobacteria bacterium]